MQNSIKVTVEMGYLQRYLEAIRNGLNVTIEEMDQVRRKYCPKCGEELGKVKDVTDENGNKRGERKYCDMCHEDYYIPGGDE